MECLPESIIVGLMEGSLEATALGHAQRHLADCDPCRVLLRELDSSRSDPSAWLEALHIDRPDGDWAPAGPLAPGSTIGDRFVLDRELGRGGMGVVWAGTDQKMSERVAIKFLKSPGPERVQRFLREVRIGVALDHPNIVRVREVVAIEGVDAPLLVMELLRGESLAARLRKGPLAMREAAAVGMQTIAALEHAHERGVVHRDLKPDNLFLVADEARPIRLVVLDFGVAKLLHHTPEKSETPSQLTRTGAVLGTPCYMAPEQLFGDRPIDRRCDVWALGVVLYECIAGRRPIEGGTFGQICERVALGKIPPLSALAPSSPAPAQDAIMRMLSRDPEDRPALAAVYEVLAAVEKGKTALLIGAAGPGAAAAGERSPTSGASVVGAGEQGAPLTRAPRARWLLVPVVVGGGLAVAALGHSDAHPVLARPSASGLVVQQAPGLWAQDPLSSAVAAPSAATLSPPSARPNARPAGEPVPSAQASSPRTRTSSLPAAAASPPTQAAAAQPAPQAHEASRGPRSGSLKESEF